MTILQAFIYGIVQGIGEFLPISSTAHLILVPWLFGWSDPGVAFDVALHLGTAAAVIMFFWKDWLKLIRAGFTDPHSKDGRLLWMIVVATVPGALFGVALDKYMESFRNPALIGVMLILMGIALYFTDKLCRSDVELHEIGIKRSVLVGLSQVLAIVPGVSRSGITMTAGRAMGLDRESIAKFTFMMSAPIILGDGLYHAMKMGHTAISFTPFATAVLTAGIVGALTIKFLLDYLKKKGFGIFAVYRFVLGAAIILMYLYRFCFK